MIERISKYRIDSILGYGAMGTVYKATDEAINRTVAIKTIHPHLLLGEAGQELLSRFKTEATAAARCQHHNIVSIYDFGEHECAPYIVMEFVNGQSLESILKKHSTLTLERISTIFLSICDGLSYAHQQGIIHRDIKPSNIIVSDENSVKIADFGIAKIENSDTTQLGLSLGTPSYMAPEQSAGKAIDCRVDIFAAGIIAFELLSLCDDIPHLLRQYAITVSLDAAKNKKIDSNTKFPQAIAAFLDHCLNPDANQRINNIADVIREFKSSIAPLLNENDTSVTTQHHTLPQESSSVISNNTEKKSLSDAGFDFDFHPDFLNMIKENNTPQESSQATEIKAIIAEEVQSAPQTELAQELEKSLTTLDIIRLLKDIHPALNHDWAEKIPPLLAQLDEDSRRRAYKNILEPKHISLTTTGKFVFSGQISLNDTRKILVTRQLNAAAEKLERLIKDMRNTRNILLIADSLEAGLNLISEVNTDDNLAQQKEKLRVMESFLYDFAIELRQHDFDLPPNRRKLTIDMIKTYIIEVFIKQKILNYWFNTLPLRELKKDNLRFINTELFDSAKVRRLSIVKTERYFFLIGEVAKFEQDPYSVRRFLLEDTAMNGAFVYFNILALERAKLADPAYQQKVREDLSKVMTIQRQLHSDIVELIESFEKCQVEYLLPLLTKPLEADGTNLQTVIEHRLRDYERNLCLLVLGKISKALKEIAQSPDDFEYLFFGLKSFLIELLGDIRDFYYQSSARWSTKSQEMEFKLVSYLRLLEKRKSSVFNSEREDILAKDDDLDHKKPEAELKKIVDETIPIILNIKASLKEAQRQAEEERNQWQEFWDGFLKRKRPEPKNIQQQLDLAAKESYVSIVRIPKRYKKTSIYLEFEGLIGIDDKVRHYAFPKGDEGVSLLPILIRLPEDTRDFDINTVKEALKPTIFSQFGNVN